MSTLFSYLEKCGHKLLLPRVVVDELKQNYREDCENINKNVKKVRTEARALDTELPPYPYVDTSKKVKEFSDFLEKFIKEKPVEIIENSDSHYKKILRKSLKKEPPFTEPKHDRSFKDAVIWECVIDVSKKKNYKPYCFITQNKKDFSDPSFENKLQPYLQGELRDQSLEYFLRIEGFLEKYGAPLLGAITKDHIFDSIFRYIYEMTEEDTRELFVYSTGYPIDSVEKGSFELSLDNFYVYKADKSNYYVNGRVILKIWAIIYDPIDNEYKDEYLSTGADISLIVSKQRKEIIVSDVNVDSPF
jgi:hypothetical protein